ncbi:MAG TPA: carbohydrate porin [Verrucomicrobiae bacterium]|nr:carbohydrate porin [Verrucomicrobiae bacterium]
MKNTAVMLGLLLAWLPLTGISQTNDSALYRWATQDYILGDWDGLRPWLSAHGADFEFFYAGSRPDNLVAGLHTGGAYEGAAFATFDLNLQKYPGLEGGSFHVSALWLNGQKLFSPAYSGDYNRVNLLDFDNAFRLDELWYQQKFFDSKLAIKAGELAIDSDFIVPEYYAGSGQFTLLNQTFFYPSLPYNVFDIPGFPATSHGLATTPLATPGAVIRWDPSPKLGLQYGLYSGSPDRSAAGAAFPVSRAGGALNYLELAWRRNPGTNNPGLGGSYKLGAYYHTSSFADVYQGVFYAVGLAPTPARHNGNYGAYLLAEQQLYLENGKADPAQQGLTAFFRALGAPADRNLTQFELDGGLVYRGLIPTRDWDTLALAGSYLEMSDDIARAQRDINSLAPGSFVPADYEGVVELNYKIQATAWWTVQTSLQHVWHPGGSAATRDATVFIVQTTLRF